MVLAVYENAHHARPADVLNPRSCAWATIDRFVGRRRPGKGEAREIVAEYQKQLGIRWKGALMAK
jgi:hypothetical protein